MNNLPIRLLSKPYWMVLLLLTIYVDTALAATPLPKEVQINGVEFVLIPEGWFYKTGGQSKDQYSEYLNEFGGGNVKVWLDSYYIAKFEARANDLAAYLNSGDAGEVKYKGENESCALRVNQDGQFVLVRAEEDLPATHLSWDLANKLSQWKGFRLPTEAEWEKAARGTDKRIYPWGDAIPDDTYAGFKTQSECYTWPVDAFKKGVSPYGVYNMAGNVREFVSDWYNQERDESLQDGQRDLTILPEGTIRENAPSAFDAGPWKMLKGGRWASHEDYIRISSRIYYTEDRAFRCNGTRFALDVATVKQHLADGSAQIITP